MEIQGLTLEMIKKIVELIPPANSDYKLLLMKQDFVQDGKVIILLSPNDHKRFCGLIEAELKPKADGKEEN